MKFRRYLAHVPAIFVKGSAIASMFYSILFVLVESGLEGLGSFSLVLAVIAPASMFFLFRYVESIAASVEPVVTARKHASAAVVGVAIGAILAVPVLMLLGAIHWFVVPLLLSKIAEVRAEVSSAYLLTKGRIREAIVSAALRLGILIVVSASLRLYGVDAVLCIASGLVSSYLTSWALTDNLFAPELKEPWGQQLRSTKNVVAECWENGLLNAAISMNSVFPRYILALVGSIEALGLFSLIYQVSATMVNLLQMAVGLSSVRAHVVATRNPRKLLNIVLWVAALIGFMAVVSALVQKDPIGAASENIARALLSGALMYVALQLRGILLSIGLVSSVSQDVPRVVMGTMGVSMLMFLLVVMPIGSFDLGGAVLFVVASSLLSSICIATLVARTSRAS